MDEPVEDRGWLVADRRLLDPGGLVNNVSLGLYAEAVQRGGYRDAKLRTLLDTVPDVLRPGVLHVRIARQHPGASPSAQAPEGVRAGLVELARIAFGRDQKRAMSTPRRPEWT